MQMKKINSQGNLQTTRDTQDPTYWHETKEELYIGEVKSFSSLPSSHSSEFKSFHQFQKTDVPDLKQKQSQTVINLGSSNKPLKSILEFSVMDEDSIYANNLRKSVSFKEDVYVYATFSLSVYDRSCIKKDLCFSNDQLKEIRREICLCK
eukprot:Awhi_evm1s909